MSLYTRELRANTSGNGAFIITDTSLRVAIETIGAGGAGQNTVNQGSGGGGGAYAQKLLPYVDPYSMIHYNVGEGGTPSNDPNYFRGGAGSNTWAYLVPIGSYIATNSTSTFANDLKSNDATFTCRVTFPNPAGQGSSNSVLWASGDQGVGAWLGVTANANVLRLRAGNGSTAIAETGGPNTAIIQTSDFPTTGETANVTWDIRVNPGRVRLWIDGVFKGQANTVGGFSLGNTSIVGWTSSENHYFLNFPSALQTPGNEPRTPWAAQTPAGDAGNGLRMYTRELVGAFTRTNEFIPLNATEATANVRAEAGRGANSTIANIAVVGIAHANASTTSVTLPSASMQPGDMVLITTFSDTIVPTVPSGYTTGFVGTAGAAVDIGAMWAYKFMVDPVDSSVTGLSSSADTRHTAIIFRGVAIDGTLDATANIVNTATTPSPGAVTTVTSNTAILLIGMQDDDIATATAPTNYALLSTVTVGAAGSGGTHATAWRFKQAAGLETPGVFATGVTDSTAAFTIPLRLGAGIPGRGGLANNSVGDIRFDGGAGAPSQRWFTLPLAGSGGGGAAGPVSNGSVGQTAVNNAIGLGGAGGILGTFSFGPELDQTDIKGGNGSNGSSSGTASRGFVAGGGGGGGPAGATRPGGGFGANGEVIISILEANKRKIVST